MKLRRTRRFWSSVAAFVVVLAGAAAAAAATAPAPGNVFVHHNLVSDVPGRADHTDPNLVNAWGLAALPTSPWWVADNEPNVSTIYGADGTPYPLVVQVPGHPTGLVANAGPGFVISRGSTSGPARFIFATEKGTILGWNPNVDATRAIVAEDSSDEGAIYKGLAIASTPGGAFLYVTDFHNARVEVYDENFNEVDLPGGFVDSTLPPRYAPFGIQAIGGSIFVTYGKQDANAEDELHGPGLGFVDEYDLNGQLLERVAQRGALNAPWGLALAPTGFGRFGGDLLIGNFGDGRITGYQPAPGTFKVEGQLRDPSGAPISIDGLWALQFGLGGGPNGSPDTLFFTAGPNDETHGLFGTINKAG
jgi:uncharacterized protein (TIGR03118 family)